MRRSTRAAIVVATAGMLLAAAAPLPAAARAAALPGDYNGDGHVDLAVAAPGEAVGGKSYAGAVNVIHGTGTVLKAARNQFWTQDSPGVKGVAGRSDGFGEALASGDFDRDGYADLAIAVPGDRVGAGRVRSGAVNVLYGSPSGLTAQGDQRWSLGNLPGKVVKYAGFGSSLAAGDIDGDGAWDLVIAVPGRYPFEAGLVVVLWGSREGLQASDVAVVDPDDLGGGSMGSLTGPLAIGDVVADGHADLAVQTSEGIVVVPGTAEGLAPGDATLWSQDTPGMVAPLGDGYLRKPLIGDFNADGYGDLAGLAEVPADCTYTWCNRWVGAVAVIYGSGGGLSTDGNQLLVPPLGWVIDDDDYGPAFGAGMAAGDLDGDGADDLAVGAPQSTEMVGGYPANRAGVVILFYGSPDGLGADRVERWSQDSAGVPGSSERGDRFGQDLAIADYGRSSRADLAIGAFGEDQGAGTAGRVTILFGRAGGLSAIGAQTWSQNSPGIKDRGEHNDQFGYTLAP